MSAKDDPRKEHGADSLRGGWLPYLLIAAVCTFCRGFILADDIPVWDGWYWVNWPKTIELIEFPLHNRLASRSTSITIALELQTWHLPCFRGFIPSKHV